MATSAEEQKKRYISLNEQVHSSANEKAAMLAEVNKQAEYRQNNPTSTSYLTDAERSDYDADAYVGQGRTTVQGTSGADEAHMSDKDYAYLQQLKNDYAVNQTKYYEAVNSGQDASQYKSAMEQAHLDAERLRSGYGYSGGADGSMYIADAWYKDNSVGGSGGGSSVGGSSAPSGPNLSGYVQDQSSYLEQLYAAKKAASLAALESAYKQNVAAIDRAGEGLEESYQNARNQTAGASELAAREFAEYAAAAGLNNGTAGQAELARGVTLQNNLNTLNSQEAQSIADLELQRANAETEYNSAIAQAEAQGNYELASALYQEKVRVQNALINAEIQEYQNALSEYSLNYQAQRDAVGDSQWQQSFNQNMAQQQWQNAQTAQQYANSQATAQKETLASYGQAFLQNGIMPSTDMLAAMGITSADAQAYINAITAQQTAAQEGDAQTPGEEQPGVTQEPAGFQYAKFLYNSTKNEDYVYRTLKANGYSDAEIDTLMALLGL